MSNVTDINALDVDFDLDAFEPEVSEVKPFAFAFHGRRIILKDPGTLDMFDISEVVNDPLQFLGIAMEDADWIFFVEKGIPANKTEPLVRRWVAHYGLEEQMKTASRKQRFGR